ncbi:death-associated inhibitor of apoptosis 2-like 9, partial [Homarus americanus]
CNLEFDTTTSDGAAAETFHRENPPQCIFLRTLNRSKTFNDISVFRFEKERLDTFVDWPLLSSWISPEDLAAAGFYYLRNKDLCVCYFCQGIVGDWKEDDTPLQKHCRLYPHCPFVKNQPTANINLGQSCILDQIIPIPETGEEDGYIPTENRTQFKTYETRLKSFRFMWNKWPLELRQQPTIHDLAETGFYYIGISDMVRCFFCGISLHNWEENDIPWNVHACWSPSCEFVILKKGMDFIKEVQDQTPPYQQSNSAVIKQPKKIYTYKVNISDDDMNYLMKNQSILKCVAMVFPFDIVKNTLYKRLEKRGLPFDNLKDCIDALPINKKGSSSPFPSPFSSSSSSFLSPI